MRIECERRKDLAQQNIEIKVFYCYTIRLTLNSIQYFSVKTNVISKRIL